MEGAVDHHRGAQNMTRPELSSEVPHDAYSNLIHLYVLHHACHWPTFGLHMIEELAGFGYRVSPGTMYPFLDAMEQKGILRSTEVRRGGTVRRLYRATAAGRKVYLNAEEHVVNLLGAMWGDGGKVLRARLQQP